LDICKLEMSLCSVLGDCALMTGYSEVMDFLVEHGSCYLRILAGNEEPVCQFKLFNQGVHLLLEKQGRWLCQNCAKTLRIRAVGLALSEKQIP
jgi:hypothetical protein